MKANKNKSFALPSDKPVDVEYRLKRAAQTLEQAVMFLNAISPAALPDDMLAGLLADATRLTEGIAFASHLAPAKKSRAKKGDE